MCALENCKVMLTWPACCTISFERTHFLAVTADDESSWSWVLEGELARVELDHIHISHLRGMFLSEAAVPLVVSVLLDQT